MSAKTKRQKDSKSSNASYKIVSRTRITPFKNQPRKHFDRVGLQELAASISEVGQITPIIVTMLEDNSEHDYVIVDGERRFIACEMAGINKVKIIVDEVADPEEHYLTSAVANFGRIGHTPLETAEAMKKVMESKKLSDLPEAEQRKKVAKIFACSEGWVTQCLSILNLCPYLRDKLNPDLPEKERMTISLAIYIASLPETLQVQIADHALKKEMSLAQARFYAAKIAALSGHSVGKENRNSYDEFRSLKTLLRRTLEGVKRHVDDESVKRLKRRTRSELEELTGQISTVIRKFTVLKFCLSQKSNASEDIKDDDIEDEPDKKTQREIAEEIDDDDSDT